MSDKSLEGPAPVTVRNPEPTSETPFMNIVQGNHLRVPLKMVKNFFTLELKSLFISGREGITKPYRSKLFSVGVETVVLHVCEEGTGDGGRNYLVCEV